MHPAIERLQQLEIDNEGAINEVGLRLMHKAAFAFFTESSMNPEQGDTSASADSFVRSLPLMSDNLCVECRAIGCTQKAHKCGGCVRKCWRKK